MCGFLGAVTPYLLAEENINAALNSINHRGPDHSGFIQEKFRDSNLLLGHTRLSIIDLSDAGSQPFHSVCGRYSLVYNGEIYNYKELKQELQQHGITFSTQTDTEVLLKGFIHWGEYVLSRLIGMFAFVLLDRESNTLTLVRDAFGIKPFFYSIENENIYFASEVAPILKLNGSQAKPDLQRAYDYLVHGDYDSTENSFFEGIKHLKPAHYLIYNLQDKHIERTVAWWKPEITTRTDMSFEDAANSLRTLFLESVKLHLRSDVPLGIALSGGIDSSAVVSAVRYLEPEIRLNTFSYIASDKSISEEYWVDTLNKAMHATPHKVVANENEMQQELQAMVLSQGEPFGSTSIYAQYRVFQLARKHGIKVTLDGQGADELLAGYSGYPGHRLLSILESKGLLAAHRYAKKWSKSPGRSYLMAWKYLARILLSDHLYAMVRKKMGRDFAPSWLKIGYLQERGVIFNEQRSLLQQQNKGNRVKEALASALMHRGLPSLLRHGDRNSMAYSIESRVPFLTIPIAEFLLSLPEHYLISEDGVTKHIFREAMRGIVPDSHLDRKDKIGFTTPESVWLMNMSEKIQEWVEQAPEIVFMDKKYLSRELNANLSNLKINDGKVWRLINYIEWYKSIYKLN